MSLLGFLKKPSTEAGATKLVSTVVSVYNPALGALVQIVGSAVYQIEIDMGSGASSDTKQGAAIGVISVAAANNSKVQAAAATVSIPAVINGVVALFNVLGIFTHKTAPANAPAASK